MILAGARASVDAHHSFAAEYDQAKPIRVEGTVVRLEVRNPHAVLELVVTDRTGVPMTWIFEMGAPRVLAQYGWLTDSVKRGDQVTVEGVLARSGTGRAAAQIVTTASGTRLRAVRPFR